MDFPICRIVPQLADRGIYLCSESSMYRLLRKHKLLAHRLRSMTPRRQKQEIKYMADQPNEIWTWDITLLRSPVRGRYYYLYLIEDVYSRKILAWRVEERESDFYTTRLIKECMAKEGSAATHLRLHADNGNCMKSATMLATLQSLGIIPSFSRPKVSNDNAHIESLFKTLKYRPEYPYRAFKNIEEARNWINTFVCWYNQDHLHSGLNYVTPNDRHERRDEQILEKRMKIYWRANKNHPRRWSRGIRNWKKSIVSALNPHGIRAAPTRHLS